MEIKDNIKQQIACLLVEYKRAGGVGLEETIDHVLDLIEKETVTPQPLEEIYKDEEKSLFVPLEFDSAVQTVIDNFNFYKVHSVMEYLGWQWTPLGRVPKPAEIKKTARELFNYIRNGGVTETGGLRVEYNKDNEELSLKFVLEQWDHWNE